MALPCELIHEILCLVPVKYLLRCRCVSKQWCLIIDSTEFVEKHFKTSVERNRSGIISIGGGNLYLADYESLRDDDAPSVARMDDPLSNALFVGSDNGVVCLCKDKGNVILLLNPSTRKWRTLPSVPAEFPRCFVTSKKYLCGFGYVNDDYKVVKVVECDRPSRGIMVIVYSFKTNSWTRVQNVPSNRNILRSDAWGRFASGTLHWPAIYRYWVSSVIDGFDLGSEQFKEVALPGGKNFVHPVRLVALGGILCFLDYQNYSYVDVLLKNDNGEESSWFKAYSMDRDTLEFCFSAKPIEYSKCQRNVLVEVDMKRLVWYHPETKTVKNINLQGLPVLFSSHMYTESLVQLTENERLQRPSHETK